LPARSRSLPAFDYVGRKADGNELARVGRSGSPALVYNGPRQGLRSELGQILVLVRPDPVRVDHGEVRLQSTARGGLSHDRWPFAC
jgi:hypothetical protein